MSDHPHLNAIGFKATSPTLTCENKFQFQVGNIYQHSGPLEICRRGFHLCNQLYQTFDFYCPVLKKRNRYFMVRYDNTPTNCYEDEKCSKVVTRTIRIEEEIKVCETLELNDMVKRYPSEHMMLYLTRYGENENAGAVLNQLLDAGADIHAGNDKALRYASERGYVKTVKLLLDAGANVHTENNQALRWASERGHTEVVKLLLDAGASVHEKDDQALRVASLKGHTETVELLLDAGADVHILDDESLRWACCFEHIKVVQLLLDRGADVHANRDDALRVTTNPDIVKLLLKHGAVQHN